MSKLYYIAVLSNFQADRNFARFRYKAEEVTNLAVKLNERREKTENDYKVHNGVFESNGLNRSIDCWLFIVIIIINKINSSI